MLFRYSPRRFNDLLLRHGILRVGTLHDFRRAEHARGIADSKEGWRESSFEPDRFIAATGSNHPDAPLLRAFGMRGAGRFFIGPGARFVRQAEAPDCFVYCMSQMFSSETMSQFEGAESCVCIHDVDGFLARLTDVLQSLAPVEYLGVRAVEYRSKEERWAEADLRVRASKIEDPRFNRLEELQELAWHKEQRFSPQYEVRAIWRPVIPIKLAPIVTGDVKLIQYLWPLRF